MSGLRTKILLCLLLLSPVWFPIMGSVLSTLQQPSETEVSPSDEVSSQTDTLRILNANTIRYDRNISEARRLIGDVVINHDSVTMYCDSAWHFEAEARIEAFGNIRIERDYSDERIYGDYLLYQENEKLAQIWDNVRALNTDAVLTTDVIYYNIGDEVIYYDQPGKIVYKDSSVLTSNVGRYFTRDRYAWFHDNVKVDDPQYIYTGDTLVYAEESRRVEFYGPSTIIFHQDNGALDTLLSEGGWIYTPDSTALFYDNVRLFDADFSLKADTVQYSKTQADGYASGNIRMISPSDSIAAYGEFASFGNEPERMMLTGNAIVKYWEGPDTLYLNADTIWSFTRPVVDTINSDADSTFREILANRDIRYYRHDIQGRCDSLYFSTQDSILRMFGKSVMWSELNQVSSDSMYLRLLNRKPNIMNLYGGPFIAAREDQTDYFNQIKGVDITIFFDQDSHLEHVEVKEDANAIYYPRDGEQFIGGNKVASQNMMIYVSDNKAESVLLTPESNGNLTPIEDILPENFNFTEFLWRDAERPKSPQDILEGPLRTDSVPTL